MTARLVAWAAALLLAALAVPPAVAQDVESGGERILEYGSELRIQPDGSLEVSEHIRVRAEGRRIRRGIYRDFPTRYEDRFGNRVVVDFQLLGVERDGRPEPYFTEDLPNGVRINTGGDEFLPVPAVFDYTIRYRTTRQLGHFPGHDELYWNVTGLGWDFPIDSAWARVTLPAAVPADQIRRDAYTGGYGEKGGDARSEVTGPAEVTFNTTRALGPQQGLTLAVGFPKGLVPVPTATQRAGWFLRDNGGVLVGLGSLLLLLGAYFWRWKRVGRDPAAGPVFPRYEAPDDLSPGEVRMLRRMGYDNRCFAADVVQMAVRGYLDIHVDGDDWTLQRRPDADAGRLTPSQQAIASKLFEGDDRVELKDSEASRIGGARTAQTFALMKRLSPRYFLTHGGSLALGLLFTVAAGVLSFIVAQGHGVVLLVFVMLAMLVANGLFGYLLKAPTREGRRRMDEIEGLRLYLSVAERDEIAAAPRPGSPAGGAPALDAARYEALLPYAMALDVEAAWSDKFTRAVGVQAAQASSPSWYHGSPGGMSGMGLAGLGSSLGSALTQHISSSATPPGSSSGGGGGGFSGGGGGGGGGGGR